MDAPPPGVPEPPAAPPAAEARQSLTLEFHLDPAAAPRLTRHPAIAGSRRARGRGVAEELIWLDSAEDTLAAAGLALESPGRGAQRLLRILPDPRRSWLPGTPPALAEDEAGADSLLPVAAFSGRRTPLHLLTPAGPVEGELLCGKLRAVADERPVARLGLSGPPEAVLALAGRLAEDLPLLPPRAALAEEGRALARGDGTPRPRLRGAPDLADAATVEEALLGAIGHLLEVMLHQVPLCRLDAGPEGVHQMRVALRRLRSVLRAFRPVARGTAVEEFDAALRALARLLGPARDWDVFLAGIGADAAAAFDADRRLAALLKAAEARRQAAYAALRTALDGPGFRRLVLDGLALLLRCPWREVADAPALEAALPGFGAGLLDKRWRRLRAEGEEIEALAAEALHELRLTAKRLRYAAELFAPLWPGKPARRFLRRLSRLQEALGEANDIAVARGLAASLGPAVPGWAVGAVEGFALGRAGPARRHALAAWKDLARTDPFWRPA